MIARPLCTASLTLLLAGATLARAQAPAAPGAREPILRVEAGGPTAFVTALAFSPDGKTLYAGGFDKVVRVWTLDPKTDRFVPSSTSYRVPIAAGVGGVINAVAVSADGTWLAAAGSGTLRGAGSFREVGWVVPRTGGMTPQMREDQGAVYAFNTRTGAVRTLRGNQGPVLSLAFDPATGEGGPLLASSAREGDSVTVRLWDLGKAAGNEETSSLKGRLPSPVHVDEQGRERITRPGLAVYVSPQMGPAVAIACDDDGETVGYLRLWEGGKDTVWEKKDGYNNTTVAYWPEEDRLLSATVWKGKAYLQAWSVVSGQGPRVDPKRALDLGLPEAPRALALLSAKGDGRRDYAALVSQTPGKNPEFSLRLVNLNTFKIQDATKPFVLWGGTAQPVVAASPKGRHLAVAGKDNAIHLYAIKDLLAGKAEPSQPPLRSEGATPRYVCFVKKGDKDRGLLLNETEAKVWDKPARDPGEAGDLVFDFARGALAADLTGWTNDAPDLRGWEFERKKGKDGTIIRARHNDRVAGEVALQPGQDLSDYALLPSPPLPEQLRVPLLAVAFVEKGETLLGLYNVATGEQVRQCTGPVNRIRSLAFSGDGRLLAAAAEDQTVCVWSLTNLDEIVGRHGLLRGLAVKENDKGRPVLAELDPKRLPPDNRERLEEKGVRKDDAVEGLVVDGKPSPTASPREFYQAVWEIAPRKQKAVTVRFGGRGDVTLAVGQGVDERKPLLSLFVTAAGAARREWVGWSPVGPYDSSGREAERLIGWHVNTGETDKPPARFALADQFRKDNYKPGILKKLIDHGNAGQAIESWQREHDGPPPDPEMHFGVKDDGLTVPPDRPNHFLVGQRRVTLTLALDGFPADKVGSVKWQALGKEGKLTAAGDGEWTADLSDVPWKRGDQAVEVVLHTAPPHARKYSGELTVRYQPPAPKVEARRKHPGATDEEKYPIEFEVIPGKGQTVRVTVWQKGQDKPVHELKDVREATKVEKELKLAAGANLIRVVAENEGTPEGDAGKAERGGLDLEVTYKVRRPQISLKKLVFDESEMPIDPASPDTPLVVDVPTFRVVGEIEALADLVSAEWAEGNNEAEALADFKAAANLRKALIKQEITLGGPGKRKIRFLAGVKGEKAESSVTVEYRPRLPTATLTNPGGQQTFYEGEGAPDVPVEVALTSWPKDPHPCQGRLWVNGEKQGEPQPIAGGEKLFKGKVHLEPGENRIEVRLGSEWREERVAAGPTVVYYRRPPRVQKMDAGKTSDRPPRVEIVATVESPNELPLDRAEITVWQGPADGKDVPGDTVSTVEGSKITMTREEGEKVTVWTIRSKDVPLREGNNVVRLVAINKDGASRKRTTATVAYNKPPPPRPDVNFRDPGRDVVVESPTHDVTLAIKSESPLTKVELRRGEEVLYAAAPADLKKQKQEEKFFKFEAKTRVALKRGANLLYAETANEEGGADTTHYVTITYHYRPVVRIWIDALEVNRKALPPAGEPKGGALPFAKVNPGKVTLCGHVSWDAEHDAALAAIRHVEVSVNGSHQPPALLAAAPPGERRRDFKMDVLLTRENNIIDVVPPRADPRFAVEAGSRQQCEVGCDAPVKVGRQLLHLLVIDVDGDRDKATKEALAAVLGDKLSRKDFQVPYCTDGGRLYGPLAGDEVIPEAVNGQLAIIQQTLQARAQAGALNDIVMVYYRGGIVKKDGAQFLHTSLSRRAREPRRSTLICCDHLARFIGDNLGAHLMFLDVTGAPADVLAARDGRTDLVDRMREPHVAFFCYTYSGEHGKRPPDAQLSTFLAKAMTNSKRKDLKEVRDRVAEEVKEVNKQSPNVPGPSQFDNWVSKALESLRFAAAQKGP